MSNESLGRRVGHMRGDARRGEIERVLSLWRSSEESRVRFCREQGISTQTLRRWLATAPAAAARPAFIEVKRSRVDAMYEVVLSSGARVRIPAGFDDAEVSRLLAVVSAC